METRQKKIINHKILNEHWFIGSILLIIWGYLFTYFISVIVAVILGNVIPLPKEEIMYIGMILGALLTLLVHKRWFYPEYEGSLKTKDLKRWLITGLIILVIVLLPDIITSLILKTNLGAPTLHSVLMAGVAGTVEAAPIITVTEVKANVSMPEAAEKAAATGADGVGLLRTEHLMLTSGIHPGKFIADGREDELIDTIADNVQIVADAFYPKPVWYRTLDAPTDEFITLEGGENEPREHNPMLGWRGIRRELDQPEILKCEFKAIKKLHEKGYTNIGIMIPLSQSPEELKQAKALCSEVGFEPHKDVDFGMMVEIPAAAIMIDEYIKVGIDFVSLGTNDLTQYTLAVDRNNEFVAKHYTEEHPAVMKLIERTIRKCAEAGVKCSICGQAGSVPHIVEKLVEYGITSVSSNTDAIADVRKTVARAEQKIILDAARKRLE